MKKENQEKQETKRSESVVRKFPKFGILDIAIILLIISVIIGIAFRYNFFNTFTNLQKLDEYAISYSVKNIENKTQYYIDNGDVVYFKNNGNNFGTIMECSDSSSVPLNTKPTEQTFIENGSTITIAYPKNEHTRLDATGRIKCKGKISSDGTFLLNGRDYLAAGQTYVICTEKVTLEITITGIEAIEKS